ncbi:hypothetical protein [Candidatus Odyssella thessalonicensis]|uniref:hypothetical protein n=1 Tax=Candidatus Odyssella thessalonicensis TaxID=84647 RepID=UPI000225AEDB|nr:hypothetical protein [Candidatus Odyssella thessalonicensis]
MRLRFPHQHLRLNDINFKVFPPCPFSLMIKSQGGPHDTIKIKLTLSLLWASANQAAYTMEPPISALQEREREAATYEEARYLDFEHHLQALDLPLEQLSFEFGNFVELASVAIMQQIKTNNSYHPLMTDTPDYRIHFNNYYKTNISKLDHITSRYYPGPLNLVQYLELDKAHLSSSQALENAIIALEKGKNILKRLIENRIRTNQFFTNLSLPLIRCLKDAKNYKIRCLEHMEALAFEAKDETMQLNDRVILDYNFNKLKELFEQVPTQYAYDGDLSLYALGLIASDLLDFKHAEIFLKLSQAAKLTIKQIFIDGKCRELRALERLKIATLTSRLQVILYQKDLIDKMMRLAARATIAMRGRETFDYEYYMCYINPLNHKYQTLLCSLDEAGDLFNPAQDGIRAIGLSSTFLDPKNSSKATFKLLVAARANRWQTIKQLRELEADS